MSTDEWMHRNGNIYIYISYNINEMRGYFAKWNKAGIERQTLLITLIQGTKVKTHKSRE